MDSKQKDITMFEEWLSRFYYRCRDKLAATQKLQFAKDTPYKDFVNVVIYYDALVKSQCIRSSPDNAAAGSGDTHARHEWLYEVYAKNCDRLATSREWQIFSDETTFEEFEDLLVYDLLLRTDCIYRPLAEGSVVLIDRCLKDEQINIAAMTEGIPVKGERFYQTIICKDPQKYPIDKLYFLVPKVTTKSDYQRSIAGLNFQKSINSDYGKELRRFPNMYVAQAVIDYQVNEPRRRLPLVEKLCKELFPLWEPAQGPLAHMEEHGSSIIAFRVYRTAADVRKHIKSYRKRVPAVRDGGANVTVLHAVTSDAEFRRQQLTLLKTFMHN
jgi:hypothetical protein